MTRGFLPALIYAGLMLPSLTACQTDQKPQTSLRDDSTIRDLAREREIQLQLATSQTR